MATIKVRVNGEIATNLTPEVRLVCQNDKYTVEFEFEESWANSNFKTALFIYNGKSVAIPFDKDESGNVCKIPALYETELLHIGVKSNDIDGLHTSTPARVGCLLSANDISNGEIPNPTPSQYDEIIRLLNEYVAMGVPSNEDIEEIASRIADEKINALINGADESFDTLKEIADWIKNHPESVAALNAKIQANASKILANETAIASLNKLVALLGSEKQNKSDSELNTASKLIVGAINELNEKVSRLGDSGLTESEVKEIVQQTAVTKETDPSVPSWAKQAKKPTYTAQEVGALPSNTPLFSGDYNDLKNKPEIPSTNGLASEEYVDKKAETTLSSANSYTDKKLSEVELTKVVDILPVQPEVGDQNKLFLIAKTLGEANDLFDEYIWVNGFWEYQGTKKFEVDLSDYQKKTSEKLATTDKTIEGAINEVNEKADGNANSLTALVETLAETLPKVVRVY